jgi:hypothetical protein
MSVWVKPGPHTHTQNVNHTSYRWGLLLSPITYKCRLRVLCPVRRPMTTLDCVLLKGNNRDLVAKSGPEINSRACLCVLQRPRHIIKCWFYIYPAFYLSSCVLPWDPQERLWSHKLLNRTVPCELIGDFISSHPGDYRQLDYWNFEPKSHSSPVLLYVSKH